MNCYKFKDTIEGNFAFIIAKDMKAAAKKLADSTSLPYVLVDERPVSELKPIIIWSRILPF